MKWLVNRFVFGREIKAWQATHTRAATEACNALAAELIVEAEAAIAGLNFTARTFRQADFITERVKNRVRDEAEALAERLLADANQDIGQLFDTRAVRLRISDYPVRPDTLFDGMGQLLRAATLSFNTTTLMHERVRDYVRSMLVKGEPDAPALLEQLTLAYAKAAKEALATG